MTGSYGQPPVQSFNLNLWLKYHSWTSVHMLKAILKWVEYIFSGNNDCVSVNDLKTLHCSVWVSLMCPGSHVIWLNPTEQQSYQYSSALFKHAIIKQKEPHGLYRKNTQGTKHSQDLFLLNVTSYRTHDGHIYKRLTWTSVMLLYLGFHTGGIFS